MAKRLTFILSVALLVPMAQAQVAPAPVAAQALAAQLAGIILPREPFLAIRVPRFDAAYAKELKDDAEILALEKMHPGITKAVAAAGSDEARKGYGAALTLLQTDVAKLYASKFSTPELATLITFFSSQTGQAMIVVSAASSGDTASEFETNRRAKATALIQNPSDATKRDLTMLMKSGLLPKIRTINPEIAALSARRFDDVSTIVKAALPARVKATIKAFQAKVK